MSNNTPCTSPCYNTEYMVNGVGVAEWIPCQGSEPTQLYIETGTYSFCHNGQGVKFLGGAIFAFPSGKEEICGCND